MKRLEESETYVTIKDHKESFPQKPTFRLWSNNKIPSKSEIKKIREQILGKINQKENTQTHQ